VRASHRGVVPRSLVQAPAHPVGQPSRVREREGGAEPRGHQEPGAERALSARDLVVERQHEHPAEQCASVNVVAAAGAEASRAKQSAGLPQGPRFARRGRREGRMQRSVGVVWAMGVALRPPARVVIDCLRPLAVLASAAGRAVAAGPEGRQPTGRWGRRQRPGWRWREPARWVIDPPPALTVTARHRRGPARTGSTARLRAVDEDVLRRRCLAVVGAHRAIECRWQSSGPADHAAAFVALCLRSLFKNDTPTDNPPVHMNSSMTMLW
jgi:hypothetical protein